MSKINRIKGKIAKLLALAASTTNTHERDSANSKAMAYLFEYRLSMGDIERISITKQEFEHSGIKISNCDSLLATGIAETLGVHVTYLQGYSVVKGRFFYVGEKSDIELARYIFEVASTQITKKAKDHRLSLGGAGTKYMNSYRNGLKLGFMWSFIKASKVDIVTESSNNTAIATLNNRYVLAKEFSGDDFKSDKREVRKDSGLLQGVIDSKDIVVNKSINSDVSIPKKLGLIT